jgi:hypothetical protein
VFWATIDLNDKSLNLPDLLRQWQDYYNHERPHSSLKDQTPWEKWQDLLMKTPLHEDIEAIYDESKERIQEQYYSRDLQLRKLKASV